jgi:hypothetical protein
LALVVGKLAQLLAAGNGVELLPLPSLTDPEGVRVLPVPAFGLSNAWLKLAVSPAARVPEGMVGVAVELLVPS